MIVKKKKCNIVYDRQPHQETLVFSQEIQMMDCFFTYFTAHLLMIGCPNANKKILK